MTERPNTFSTRWYHIFHDRIPDSRTDAEVAFLASQLPQPTYRSIMDLCCGPGRHAERLAALGYDVLGIESKPGIVPPDGAARYHTMDARDIASLSLRFDGVVNLWQSFGYYDDDTNRAMLRSVFQCLRANGRFVLDVYNRDAIQRLPDKREYDENGTHVTSHTTWHDRRATVRLRYVEVGEEDTFTWRLYTPRELEDELNQAGFEIRLVCAWFDPTVAPTPDHGRMQFVAERPG